MTDTRTDLWTTLSAHDPRALIDFLVEAFGFREVVAHTNDDGTVAHAELVTATGRGGLMLGAVKGDGSGPTSPTRPGQSSAYVVVDDLEALFARARSAGARVLVAPMTTDYGSRDCAFLDPEGNRWFFGTYAGHEG